MATARRYCGGKGVVSDAAAGFKWKLAAAKAGNIVAQYNVAVAYLGGTGVSADAAKAEVWLRAAANAGNCVAQLELSKLSRHALQQTVCSLCFALENGRGCQCTIAAEGSTAVN